MQTGAVAEAVAALRAAVDALAACDLESLDAAERVALLADLETHRCRLPALEHRLVTSLDADTPPSQLGAKNLANALQVRLNLHPREAKRRVAVAADLGPRRSLTGQSMPPNLPATAIAEAHGLINGDHVAVIRKAVAKIPDHVDPKRRQELEVAWARAAMVMAPHQFAADLKRTLYLLDQDGPEPTHDDGVRRRGMTVGKQGPDGTVAMTVVMTAPAWAALEVLLAKFATPGMCNPADAHPCTSGTPSQAQIDGDDRTLAQRRHDALAFLHRTALAKGELGHLNGVPTAILIRTTLADLESRAGVGVTGGGTVLTRRDILQLAAQSTTTGFLTLFDDATGKVLDLFQTRRTATVVQRLALITRDGGCTKPGCTVPAYGCQVHHAKKDFAAGGNTNVNDNALACGADNRLVGTTGGWTTRINAHHHVEWLPPPLLDRGQTRINTYHHPERLHSPPGGGESGCAAGESPPAETRATGEATAVAPADPPGDASTGPTIDDPWAPEHHPPRAASP